MGLGMTGNEIREKFLQFFEGRGHRVVRSSSLVPANDPTLLFTNAGMNQFKDVFLGLEKRDYVRATSCQKCVRAGGKHNDLENVGYTNRHHTFFEMLGNFSFGDYFKKEAIGYAWELVTSPGWFAIPKDKLFVTIFKGDDIVGRDTEAYEHWLAQGVDRERIYEFGAKENFWAMGDTGPCGPCSEIHYDMGPAASDHGHADCAFGCECGRYVEIWNLVFMQFNRDAHGALNPLPRPSVDTGAGLERLAAVLQGKISNFDTDLFMPLIERAEQLANSAYGISPEVVSSLHIIADHSRAITFLISDGVVPSNEGRGYVLRKILRRAIRHGRFLGVERPFLHDMVHAVSILMGSAYPELRVADDMVSRIALAEEERFAHTIAVGLKKLETDLQQAREWYEQSRDIVSDPDSYERVTPDELDVHKEAARAGLSYSGESAFRLYDTFGLPRDFIEDVTRDAGIPVRWAGFDRAMEEQRTRAKASWKGKHKEAAAPVYAKLAETFCTEPDFYFGTKARDCHIEAIITKEGGVNELRAGEEGEIVLDRTSIYAESGGQQADTGSLRDAGFAQELAIVTSAYYPVGRLIAHRVTAKEVLRVGDRVCTSADAERRIHNQRNHTATHLLNAALRNILGTHVKQAGSLVAPDHLRFDFSHFAAVDECELRDIEDQVNGEVLRNLEMRTDIMAIDQALASGALAFFGDKYPEQNVRVVTVLDPARGSGFYSKELCGGTHISHTGEIGLFKIVGEQSVAAGVRRVQAITGDATLDRLRRAANTLQALADRLNVGEEEVQAKIEQLVERAEELQKERDALQRKSALGKADELIANARRVKDVPVVAANVGSLDRDTMRQLVDTLRQKLVSGVVTLISTEDGKVALITGVTRDLIPRLHAGKIVQTLARHVGGAGGGRPDLAEAGGKDAGGVETAIAAVFPLIDSML
jgi:alanyl-tRNA synthetase